MRKTVLAMILALTAFMAGFNQAAAMDGFDLGDMPPLPPPLLDDTPAAAPLTPPASGSGSPLVQGGDSFSPPPAATPPRGSLTPPSGGALTPPPSTATSPSFSTPMPPPPPLSPTTPVQPPAPVTTGAPMDVSGLAPAPSIQLPAANESPLPAKITGGRVNVRAGPSTQYEAVAVLTTGTPITVLARHGEWYKIIYPADQLASIHKNYIDAEISGEIPEAGLPGTVNQNDADVHAFYWDGSTVVGKLNRGDPVIIKQERGQWYRIAAPATARAYVSAEYTRVDGGAQQVAADSAPPPSNPNVDLSATADGGPIKARLSKDDERLIALKEAHFKRMRENYYKNVEDEEAAAKEASEKLAQQAKQLDSALEDLDARLKAIDEETGQRMGYIYNSLYNTTTITTIGSAAWAPPDPAYGGYTGWVENIGRVGGAPATYRLSKGGEIRFFLRSASFNLDDYVGRRVWLNGAIEPAAGGSAAILNVEQIRILTELEIAEGTPGVPQQYGVQQPPAADPYDPYGAAVSADPYASYGTPTTISDPNALPGTVGGVGAVFQAQPTQPQAGPTPSDASQLPDVVGMGGQIYIALSLIHI